MGVTRASRLPFALWFALLISGCASAPQGTTVTCQDSLRSSIKKFCQVTPNVLWRGAQPDKDGAAWLIQRGVRTIVNLELLHDDRDTFSGLNLERLAGDQNTLAQTRLEDTGKYEVGYFRVRDWEVLPIVAPWLSDNRVAHFLSIVSREPKPIYVHCRSGENRTSVMVAAYKVIVEGEGDDHAIENAIDEMKRYQGFWFEADAAYIRSLLPERREKIRRKALDLVPRLKEKARVTCEAGKCRVSEE